MNNVNVTEAKQRTEARPLKPRLRQLRNGAWWCTWVDGTVSVDGTARHAYLRAKQDAKSRARRESKP